MGLHVHVRGTFGMWPAQTWLATCMVALTPYIEWLLRVLLASNAPSRRWAAQHFQQRQLRRPTTATPRLRIGRQHGRRARKHGVALSTTLVAPRRPQLYTTACRDQPIGKLAGRSRRQS